MKPALRRSLWAVGLLAMTMIALLWFRDPPSVFPPLPQPNGYLALMHTAALVQKLPDRYRELSTGELAEAVARNEEALAELRRSLPVPGAVTVQMSESWFSVHGPELMNLKTAASALDADAELGLRRGDTNAALDAALHGLRLSEAMQRGGLVIDFLVAVACEAIAVRRLTNVIEGLNAGECRRALTAVQEHETRRESVETIQAREREWARRSFGIHRRIGAMISSRSLNPNAAFTSSIVRNHQARTQEARRLLLRLAARAYNLERGAAPKVAADLVPAYLPQLPVDPATGQPLQLP